MRSAAGTAFELLRAVSIAKAGDRIDAIRMNSPAA